MAIDARAATAELRAAFERVAPLVRALPVTTTQAELLTTLEKAVEGAGGGIGVSGELLRLLPSLRSLVRDSGTWPEVVISRAQLGVAATGSVVICEPDHRDRLMALLCLTHIVLLPGNAFLPTVADASSLIRRWIAAGRRYTTIVTGPSRTSDIERVLTIGAHGPRDVMVVIVDDWTPDAA